MSFADDDWYSPEAIEGADCDCHEDDDCVHVEEESMLEHDQRGFVSAVIGGLRW